MGLEGKAILVTGAQQGIGAAIARALAREGARLALNWLDDRAAARQVAADVRAAGSAATLIQGSVADLDAVVRMVEAGRELGGASGLGGLVNNAGVFPRARFLDLTEAEWDRVQEVNLKGAFRCAQAAARAMAETGRGGSIVNLSSLAAFRPSARGAHYAAAKAGLIGLTRAAALELAPHRIRVNAIAPGLTDTAQPRGGMSEAELAAASSAIPLGRMALPEDVAALVVFLLSDQSCQITGQTLHLNGGQSLQ